MAFRKIPKTRRSRVSIPADFDGIQQTLPFRDFSPNIAQQTDEDKAQHLYGGEEFDRRDEVDFVQEKSSREKIEIDFKGDGGEIVPHALDEKIEPSVDETESAYTNCEMFWSLFAICSYIVDIGSDLFLAFMYFSKEHYWYFGLTIGFAIASSLTVTVVSLTWYKHDTGRWRVSRKEWAIRFVMHVFQFGPVLRYIDTIRFGVQSRRAKGSPKRSSGDPKSLWYQEKIYEDVDASLLRLFECYLEAAPQLTLQLYIIIIDGLMDTKYSAAFQIFSCVSSLTSIAWALTAYHSALRFSLDDRSNMTNASIVAMFLWRLFSITARVLALAIFASVFHFYVSVVIGIHVAVMFSWLLSQETKLCASRLTEFVFVFVLALLCTFDYFNAIDGHTRLRYLFFNGIVIIENVAMALTFFIAGSSESQPILLCSLMASVVTFHLIALALQLLYYLVLHPNNSTLKGRSQKIRVFIPCSELLKDCCGKSTDDDQLQTSDPQNS